MDDSFEISNNKSDEIENTIKYISEKFLNQNQILLNIKPIKRKYVQQNNNNKESNEPENVLNNILQNDDDYIKKFKKTNNMRFYTKDNNFEYNANK